MTECAASNQVKLC